MSRCYSWIPKFDTIELIFHVERNPKSFKELIVVTLMLLEMNHEIFIKNL